VASRSLTTFVALTMSFALESRAQESATPDAAKAAPSPVEGQSKDSVPATPGSLGDKKTASPSDSVEKSKPEQATFGGGCFWHVEAVFERLKGVNSAVSGYAGGSVPYPSYEMVHEGMTGHAEVVMVNFDPDVISYEDLLKVFWKNHDPTSINRQGEDEGPQYRSVIFYHNEAQRQAALKSYHALTDRRAYRRPIVTQLMPMRAFYRAEDYHQDYYGGKPRTSTRRKVATTKVKKSRVTKGKGSPPAAKPLESDSVESAPSQGPRSQSESPSSL
jgi:peptide-methionine (S)-S-oxide reductase